MRAVQAACLALLATVAAAVDIPFDVVVSSDRAYRSLLVIEVGPMARLLVVGNATVEQVSQTGEAGNITATEVPRASLALWPEGSTGRSTSLEGTGCGRPWHAAINLVPENPAAVAASVERNETARPWTAPPPPSTAIVGRGAAMGGRFRMSVLTCGSATLRVRGVARIVWPAPRAHSWPPSTGPLGGDGVVTPFALAGHGVLVPLGPALGHGLATPAAAAVNSTVTGTELAEAGFRWVHTSPALESEPALLVMEAASHALLLLLWLTWTLVPGCFARTDAACRASCGRCGEWVEGSGGRYRDRAVVPMVRPLDGHVIGVFQRRSAAAEAVVGVTAVVAVAAALANAAVLDHASAGRGDPGWVLSVALLSPAVRPLMLVSTSLYIGQVNSETGRTRNFGALAMLAGATLDLGGGVAERICNSSPLALVTRQASVDTDSCSLLGAMGAFISGIVGLVLVMASLSDLGSLRMLQADISSAFHFFVVSLRRRTSHLRTLGILLPAGQVLHAILSGLSLDWRTNALSIAALAAAQLGWWGTLLFVVRPDPGVPGSGLSSVLSDCLQPGLRAARASRMRGFADGLGTGLVRLLCRLACGACCCCYSAHGALRSPTDMIPTRRSGGHGGYRGWKLAAASGELGTLDAMRRSDGVVLLTRVGTQNGDTD